VAHAVTTNASARLQRDTRLGCYFTIVPRQRVTGRALTGYGKSALRTGGIELRYLPSKGATEGLPPYVISFCYEGYRHPGRAAPMRSS
jgi:hypothetical protein